MRQRTALRIVGIVMLVLLVPASFGYIAWHDWVPSRYGATLTPAQEHLVFMERVWIVLAAVAHFAIGYSALLGSWIVDPGKRLRMPFRVEIRKEATHADEA